MATRVDRRTGRHTRRLAAAVVLPLVAVALAACGSSGSDGRVASSGPSGSSSTTAGAVTYPSPGRDQEYEAWPTVLQTADGEAMLCLGGVAESLPPQCSGPPITNWDWEATPPADHRNGVRWGDFHVRGTFDGKQFTLTRAPRPIGDGEGEDVRPDDHSDRATTPCDPPAGGWTVVDPSNVTDYGALSRAAQAEPDFGGFWLDDLQPPSDDGYQDLAKVVITVSFTGDLARHEADLRPLWGGPLCIAKATVTKRQLDAATERLTADTTGSKLGDLEVMGFGPDEVHGKIHLEVVWAPDATPDELGATLSERYGVPIEVGTALQPVT